ncbi:DUF4032 domain-containing protein [Nocardioides sp. HDW12B]|uniref:DUF4032 domain-containing protein n=1 Tax=Nocardioides sp. HDW12B TaxID=2714939 RepID=UPI00140E0548|nr:DUF4032 domain-containing protein [Nocardioides sp. HDW12B]QIK66490.1 DUF4032 domain-containing protein [Nocardioides sp. HDW12B]
MALRLLATKPNPELVRLPWHLPLEEWGEDVVLPLPRGISRHVVRIVRVGTHACAVKETQEPIARREYELLRDLRRLDLPTVVPQAVVTGRRTRAGEELPSALVTRHLRFSLPYRSLFSHGMRADSLPSIVDALVVLLVRLHLSGFFWGDVSLSNVLFRRSAGEFAAYLVDAETGELRPQLSDGQRRHDLTVATENVFAELLDLQAGGFVGEESDPTEVIEMLSERYDALWAALTRPETFSGGDTGMWKIAEWMESLNDLGFDVDEMDIVSEGPGERVRLQPRVVEAGHHRRELWSLTGLETEEGQARRLLNDMASYGAHFSHDLPREALANRWLTEVYEPLVQMVPREMRGRLEPPEIFHEVLVHRWLLSERAGHEIDFFESAQDYIDTVLTRKPEEAVTTPADDPEALMGGAPPA